MLYNIELKCIKANSHCFKCRYFDKHTKRCSGIGKVCFEYDEKTQTIIDSVTKLPLKINNKEKE